MADFTHLSNFDKNASFSMVRWSADSPILEVELNEMQQILAEARADVVRKAINSGFQGMGLNNSYYTNGVQASNNNLINEFLLAGGLSGIPVLVNGNILNISGSGDGTSYAIGIQLDAPPASNVTPSLPGSARDDLVFLEAWFQEVGPVGNSTGVDTNVYTYGGVTSGTDTNNIEDTRLNIETTHRVQLRWRIRVVDGVDFTSFNEGMNYADPAQTKTNWTVQAQGGASAPLSYNSTSDPTTSNYLSHAGFFGASNRPNATWGKTQDGTDTGVYIAGDGSATSQTLLQTLDGYVYAIPLFRVRRRNSNAFDPDTNPLGGKQYYSVTVTPTSTVNVGASGTFTLSSTDYAKVSSGDILYYSSYYILSVTALDGNNTITATNVGTNQFTSQLAGMYLLSDRPDGLYSNIIDATDITDLRHQVSLTGFNYQALLEKNLDLLLRGQLTTSQNVRYGRDYIGLNTSNYTDDVNTLLYCKFDDSVNGTANGSTVTGTANGSVSYGNGVQGQSYYAGSSEYVSYPVSIASGSLTYSIELLFRPNGWMGSDSSFRPLLSFNTANGGVLSFYKAANGQFRLFYTDGTAQNNALSPNNGFFANIPANMPVDSSRWYKILISVNNGTATVYMNGVNIGSGTVPALAVAVTNIHVGDCSPIPASNDPADTYIDLVRVSNIARTEQLLPSTFNGETGDVILDGANADFAYYSDDVGGTAGVNGRTNPYGLSRVPNQIAARVNYNGSEIRHYYGNGITAGMVAGTNFGSTPTGSFDASADSLTVSSNETADGTRTTFTFSKPANAPSGYAFAIDGNSTSNVVIVNSSWSSYSSATYNPSTGVLTVTFTTAPASGASVQTHYGMVQRHAHFVPSTKGFIVHDWTDDAFSNVNGTTTVFQTTKYNVTAVNHVRVTPSGQSAGTIQNGGYSTSGLNANTTLTAGAALNATTITVASGANFVNGQNIRISDGNGGWVTATISSISGTTITLTAGLSAAVSQNATVQGAALVTFTSAPAANSTVDIVYESVLTPSLGDYIRVMYQHTPYQGFINTMPLTNYTIGNALLLNNYGIITTKGTGKYRNNNWGDTNDFQNVSTNFPMNGWFDYSLKADSPVLQATGTTDGNAVFVRQKELRRSYSYSSTIDQAVSIQTLSQNYACARGYNGVGFGNEWFDLLFEPVTSSLPTLLILPILVQNSSTDEILLLVGTHYFSGSGDISFSGSSDTNSAWDVYHLLGRPLVKGYGGVTA